MTILDRRHRELVAGYVERWQTHYQVLLVEVCGKIGQAEALAFVERAEEHYVEAELYRLKGELTLQESQVGSTRLGIEGEAEACFRKAIVVAQQQQAKAWKLRSATSLARLCQLQGKPTEAYQLLAEIYHWFTEGFDTKDLQEAKALLEELL